MRTPALWKSVVCPVCGRDVGRKCRWSEKDQSPSPWDQMSSYLCLIDRPQPHHPRIKLAKTKTDTVESTEGYIVRDKVKELHRQYHLFGGQKMEPGAAQRVLDKFIEETEREHV